MDPLGWVARLEWNVPERYGEVHEVEVEVRELQVGQAATGGRLVRVRARVRVRVRVRVRARVMVRLRVRVTARVRGS